MVCVCADACRRPIRRFGLKGWLGIFAVAVAIPLLPFLFLRQFLLQPFYIPTGGMQPTLMGKSTTPDGHEKPGDSIMVDKVIIASMNPGGAILLCSRPWALRLQASSGTVFRETACRASRRESFDPPPVPVINGNKVVMPGVFETIASGSSGFSGYIGAGRLSSDRERWCWARMNRPGFGGQQPEQS